MLEDLASLQTVRGRPVTIRKRDVLEHLDSAVAAGVRSTPAFVLDGRSLASGASDSRTATKDSAGRSIGESINVALTISEAAEEAGFSSDTLRYYEKIRLLPPPGRTSGGKRVYRDMARLRFIRRAQSVGFSLNEIAQLLRFRENPAKSGRFVRELAASKYAQVKEQLELLKSVEAELALLLRICSGDSDNCPILETLDGSAEPSRKKRASR